MTEPQKILLHAGNQNLSATEAFNLVLGTAIKQAHVAGRREEANKQADEKKRDDIHGALAGWLASEGLRCKLDIKAVARLNFALEPFGITFSADFLVGAMADAKMRADAEAHNASKQKPARKPAKRVRKR